MPQLETYNGRIEVDLQAPDKVSWPGWSGGISLGVDCGWESYAWALLTPEEARQLATILKQVAAQADPVPDETPPFVVTPPNESP